jgi:uncharacterized protein YcbK (DUF882 family)
MERADWGGLQFFTPDEFANPDKMGYEFMYWLDSLRQKAGVPMYVSSSYRSTLRNERVGGAHNSAHTDDICNAVDIKKKPRLDDPNWNLSRFLILNAATALGCVRIGLYANGSLHFDRTEDIRPSPRLWVMVNNPARL